MSILEQLQHSIKTIFSLPTDAPKTLEEEWKDVLQTLKFKLDQSKAVHKKEVDWEEIASESTRYLSDAAKDIRVARYLCHAWAELYSVAGLNAGMHLLTELTTVPDKQLYPHKGRARAQQFEAVFYFCLQFMRRDDTVDTSSIPLAVEKLEKSLKSHMQNEVFTSTAIKHIEKIKHLGGISVSAPVEEKPASSNTPVDNTPIDNTHIEEANEIPKQKSSENEASDKEPPAHISEDITEWLAPISSTEPAGRYVIDTDDYGKIKQHINNIHGVTKVNWPQLLDECESLLRHSSKDLQIACYAVYALVKIDGVSGIDKGLQLLQGLLEKFGDQIFPRQTKRRVVAVAWLTKKLNGYLAGVSPGQLVLAELKQVLIRVDSINSLIESIILQDDQQLNDLHSFRSKINKLISKLDIINKNKHSTNNANTSNTNNNNNNNNSNNNQASVSGDASATSGDKQVEKQHSSRQQASQATNEIEAISNDAEFRQYIQAQKKSVRLAADYLRKKSSDDPRAYKMLRLFYWASLSESGFSRKMRPPPETLKTTLLNHQKNKEWTELLHAAETAFDKHCFWLDLNYWSSSALAELGLSETANSVLQETQGLTLRFPTILEGEFTCGMAFASDETKLWLQGASLKEKHSSNKAQALHAKGSTDTPSVQKEPSTPTQAQVLKIELTHRDDELASLEASVQGHIQQKQPMLAVELLENAIASASSGRERFLYQTLLAQLFLTIGLYEASLSCLEYLDAEIKRHNIEFWEKNLSIRVASLICELLPHIESNQQLQSRGQILRERAYQCVSCLYPRELLKQTHPNAEQLISNS